MTDTTMTPSGENTKGTAEEKPATIKRSVKIYTRYERFWHWSQALLIFTLTISGFNLHGTFSFMPFPLAVTVHTYAAIALIILWMFTYFWGMTTGQWRHFMPHNKGLFAVIKFYAIGILTGSPHPYAKNLRHKQNPLQSLAYLGFMTFISPAIWLSGLAYLFYGLWSHIENAQSIFTAIVFVHTAAAFMTLIFVVVHIYMTTTGKTLFYYIKGMITGYETIELTTKEEAYLKEQEPQMLSNKD